MPISKNVKTNPDSFQVLHISDLHIASKEDFDRSVVLDPLIDRIREDRDSGLAPEIVIVSGDIAKTGIDEEYQKAKEFFDDLLACLSLSSDRILMVPGNHDVKRDCYRPTDVPEYDDMKELNAELEIEDYRADLLKGMEDYFRFVEIHYPHLRSRHGRLVPFVVSYPANCGKRIGLIGLNSAWMCRRSDDNGKIAIGEYQVKNAMEELKETGEQDLIIAAFHHPLCWLWPKDRSICRRHFNNLVLLSGHLHDEEGENVQDLHGSICKLQAGCAYTGSGYPNSFHYISFDWAKSAVTVDFRKFDACEHKWCVYGEKGKDGRITFSMFGSEKDALEPVDTIEQNELFQNYLQAALNEHRHLPTQGFETNLRFPIEIERIYINMHAYIHVQDFEFTIQGRNRMMQRIREERLDSLDLKQAFEAAERHNIKDMVILGDPGSGKTTLLKFILIMLIQGKGRVKLGLDQDLIPFFAPLRRLKDPDKEEFLDFIKNSCCIEDHGISRAVLKKALDDGRGILLLDGLDEVADEPTRVRVCEWIEKARKRFPKTKFIITSRFAGYLGRSRLEGSLLELSIKDFTMDEVEEFLVRWFETVETAFHPGGDEDHWQRKGHEDALLLVERIRKSKHLKKLAVNPLLLQIIALVHRDRGTLLPQRRVELYEECTNVLLEKWDMAKGLDVLLTAREARRILQPLALWLHEVEERRFASVDEIKRRIEEPLEEIRKSDVDPETLLLNIRDRSGIFMGFSEREYGFTHLSFQEYLAAEQIRNKRDIKRLLSEYGNKWWREVILLCLALDNPSIIEEFLEGIIPMEKFSTEIDLVAHALDDSIIKPSKPFIDAIGNEHLSAETKCSAVRVLKDIGGERVIQKLREVVNGQDRQLALVAFETLETLGAAEGITRPVPEEIPETLKNPKDESMMVLVPAGTFLYGSREDDKTANSNEKPQVLVDLPSFYIDIYPVTNEQYCRFLNETMPDKDKLNKYVNLKGEQCRIISDRKKYSVEKGYERHPVVYATWYGADAYAKWSGKRLPNEQEWEKGARGTDGRIYPWGDEFDKDLCNSYESGIHGTSEVGSFPNGKSPYGCYDMAGNVWEWTESWYDKKEMFRVLRGGSWGGDQDDARCAYRLSSDPDVRYFIVGFRCVRTK